MYQTVNNTLCLTVNDWVAAGLTVNQFRHDSKRGFLSIPSWGRGWNGNTMIDVRSIKRPDRLEVIQRAYGQVEAVDATLHDAIEIDVNAVNYYQDYRYSMDTPLPMEAQELYVNNASVLEYLKKLRRNMTNARARHGKKIGGSEWWQLCLKHAKDAHNSGFTNTLHNKSLRYFERLYNKYINEGYISLIDKAFGNKTALKLYDEAKEWLVARWASPVNKVTMQQLFDLYNAKCADMAKGDSIQDRWKPVKEIDTIERFLNSPEVMPLWYGSRYGELKAKEKFTRQHRTILPQVRDALWYGDGTRLNFFYRDSEGKTKCTNVYMVMDVFSEVFLGYYIHPKENYIAQYGAYKEAFQFAGHKPYEIKFDNQGGHKLLLSRGFFKKLSRLAVLTKPYNGKSKTIESAFGRFQSQYLHKEWYFTGQNVTAKKEESKYNQEFVMANQANLPALDEVKKTFAEYVKEWNEAAHYLTGERKIDMYRNSVNDKSPKVEAWDMIFMFGCRSDKAIIYRSNGISMTVKGQKYAWEVLTAEGEPNFDFLRQNTGRKFIVEYDPEDMSVVSLYEQTSTGDLRFVAIASKYINVHRDKQSQDEFDNKFIPAMQDKNDTMRKEMQERTEELLERHGLHPSQHGLNMPKILGVNSKRKTERESLGKMLKRESELVLSGDFDDAMDVWDRY